MNLEWIIAEEQKWEKEFNAFRNDSNYESEITKEFKEYIQGLNEKMYGYYGGSVEKSADVDIALKKKRIIDENGQLKKINFQYTSKTHNGGHSYGYIYLNPKSAFLLYNTYREFLNGNLDGIRLSIDYESIQISDLDKISQLTRKEMLYWCFVHQITFEEFSKMTFVHECSHQYGLSEGEEDDYKLILSIMEGITEFKARKFSKDLGIPFLPIYRQLDFEIIKELFNLLQAQFDFDILPEFLYFSLKDNLYDFSKIVLLNIFGENIDVQDYYNELDRLDDFYVSKSVEYRNKLATLGNIEYDKVDLSFLDIFEFENNEKNVFLLIEAIKEIALKYQKGPSL